VRRLKLFVLKIYWLFLAGMSRLLRQPRFGRRQRLVIRRGILNYDKQDFFRFHTVTSYRKSFRREAKALAGKNVSVLDLGGGDGRGFDWVFEGIEGFPGSYTSLDVRERPSEMRILVADACKPIVTDERFDVTFTHNALEHMPDPFAVAENMYNLLKPGGLVLAKTVFACHHHASPSDYWRFTDEGMRYLYERMGFVTVEFGYDITRRRREKLSGKIPQSMPVIDSQGGWRELWWVYYIGRKPAAPQNAAD
jgi:ubiquinone/menaquinone biosynthesis C-methylase UbiE